MFKLSKRLISPELRVLMLPVLVIAVVIFLFIALVNLGYPRISAILGQINDSEKTESVLEERLSILREFNTTLSKTSDISFIVLPDKNPGTWTISQIKDLSSTNSILFTDTAFRKSSKGSDQAVNQMDIEASFESSNFSSVAEFLIGMAKVAPLTTTEEVEIKKEEGIVSSKISFVIYWASLPATLPSLTQPLKSLTVDEQETLNKIMTYKVPQFTSLSPLPGDGSRLNPFN